MLLFLRNSTGGSIVLLDKHEIDDGYCSFWIGILLVTVNIDDIAFSWNVEVHVGS